MKLGLIGEKLSHSYSAWVHKEFGYDYRLKELAKNELEAFVKSGAFDAFNITIPYKKEIIRYLDALDPLALRLQSVNTVVKRDGKLIGYNTDYRGMQYMLKKANISLRGKKVLILGSGGTSNMAKALALDMDALPVIVSRSGPIDYINFHLLHGDAEIVINTTPVGMYPNNGRRIIDLALLPNVKGVAEVIYNPLRTPLSLQASELGISSAEGLALLVAQAKYARDLFFSETADDEIIDNVLLKLKKNISNFVLIGMPSSGKTTKGRILASRYKRNFIDTDKLITERAGKSIECIFREDKEARFREIESEVIAEAGRLTGQVIATGGGAVIKKENRDALKQNGLIIYVKRDIANLELNNRPLSKDKATLEKMYEARKSLYEDFADITVFEENIEECVNQIEEKINEYFGNQRT